MYVPINMEAPNRRKDRRPRAVFAEQRNLLFFIGARKDCHFLPHERVVLVVVVFGHRSFKLLVADTNQKDARVCKKCG